MSSSCCLRWYPSHTSLKDVDIFKKPEREVVSTYKSSLYFLKKTLVQPGSTFPLFTKMINWHSGPANHFVLLSFSILIIKSF